MRPPTDTTSLLRAIAAADEAPKGHEVVANVQEYLHRHRGKGGSVVLAGEETLALAARSKAALERIVALGAAPPPVRPPNRAQRKLIAQQEWRQAQVAKANQARQAAQARAREARDIAARAEGLADDAERRSVKAAQRETDRIAAEAAVVIAQQQAREATEAAQLEAAEAITAASAAQECLALVTQAIERAQHAADIATGIARRCV